MPPHKVRRPGYAPATNVGVGRRGLHTRDRILACASDVFLANGFHSVSLDTIAKAAKASRATVYQYFAGKEDIFRELSAAAGRDVLDHGRRLRGLGPTADGVTALHRWLAQWADIYDTHAAVFAEFPGIGTATRLSVIDTGAIAVEFARTVTDHLRTANVVGIDARGAAEALMRTSHMVNLYRYRAWLPLPERAEVSRSLAAIVQLMLFPETPADALLVLGPGTPERPSRLPAGKYAAIEPAPQVDDRWLSPIAEDVLSVSSAMFAESGYYAVAMEEIAVAADISRATLYRYFSTKDKILAELTRRAVAEVEETAALLPGRTAKTLPKWMVGYVRFQRAYRGVSRAWFDGTVAEQLSDAEVDHGGHAILRAIAALLRTVELPPDVDRDVAAAVFLSVLTRMSEPISPDGSDSEEQAAQLMVALLQRSLLRTLKP